MARAEEVIPIVLEAMAAAEWLAIKLLALQLA